MSDQEQQQQDQNANDHHLLTKLAERLSTLEQKNTSLEHRVHSQQAEITGLREQLRTTKNGLESQISSLNTQLQRQNGEIDDLRQKIQQHDQRLGYDETVLRNLVAPTNTNEIPSSTSSTTTSAASGIQSFLQNIHRRLIFTEAASRIRNAQGDAWSKKSHKDHVFETLQKNITSEDPLGEVTRYLDDYTLFSGSRLNFHQNEVARYVEPALGNLFRVGDLDKALALQQQIKTVFELTGDIQFSGVTVDDADFGYFNVFYTRYRDADGGKQAAQDFAEKVTNLTGIRIDLEKSSRRCETLIENVLRNILNTNRPVESFAEVCTTLAKITENVPGGLTLTVPAPAQVSDVHFDVFCSIFANATTILRIVGSTPKLNANGLEKGLAHLHRLYKLEISNNDNAYSTWITAIKNSCAQTVQVIELMNNRNLRDAAGLKTGMEKLKSYRHNGLFVGVQHHAAAVPTNTNNNNDNSKSNAGPNPTTAVNVV